MQSCWSSPTPPWMQPRGKWMVSSVNSHTDATSKRLLHLWQIDLRFALNSTPGWSGLRLARPTREHKRTLVETAGAMQVRPQPHGGVRLFHQMSTCLTFPSEKGTTWQGSRTFSWKSRPVSGLDYRACAISFRQRTRNLRPVERSKGLGPLENTRGPLLKPRGLYKCGCNHTVGYDSFHQPSTCLTIPSEGETT